MSPNQPRHRLLMAEAKDLSPSATEILIQAGDTTLAQLSRAELLQLGQGVTLLWMKLGTKIDQELISAFPELRCLAVNTTGLSHVDLNCLEQRGIALLSLKGETSFLREIRATAELSLLLILSLLRRSKEAFSMGDSGRWQRMEMMGEELAGKTVGIVGFGRLGRITAQLALAFGAGVLWCDVLDAEPMKGTEKASLEEILQGADIVSLHASWAPGDPPILGQREFELMKPGAKLVNTARGELIDEPALLQELQSGRIAAALDVIADEQGQNLMEHPLVRFAQSSPKLLLTPHIGGATKESSEKTEVFMAQKILSWCESNPL